MIQDEAETKSSSALHPFMSESCAQSNVYDLQILMEMNSYPFRIFNNQHLKSVVFMSSWSVRSSSGLLKSRNLEHPIAKQKNQNKRQNKNVSDRRLHDSITFCFKVNKSLLGNIMHLKQLTAQQRQQMRRFEVFYNKTMLSLSSAEQVRQEESPSDNLLTQHNINVKLNVTRKKEPAEMLPNV